MHKKILLLALLLLAACRPQTATPSVGEMVAAAVSATLTALPTAPTAAPGAAQTTPRPTPTPDLRDLFCEYGFCIGHPPETYLFDGLALRENRLPSNYASGLLISYQADRYIQVNWSAQPGQADPYAFLQVIAEADTLAMENLTVEQINGQIVTLAPVLKTAAPNVLPYGLAATWTCGDRQFGWKAYTQADGQAYSLLQAALARFYCVP